MASPQQYLAYEEDENAADPKDEDAVNYETEAADTGGGATVAGGAGFAGYWQHSGAAAGYWPTLFDWSAGSLGPLRDEGRNQ